MLESYYEIKTKDFYELRLGQMTMEDLINKFLNLLWFVPYIKEEKVKVEWFLSCFPQSCKVRIKFDNPKTLDEVLRKERLYFEHYRKIKDTPKAWKDKKQEKLNQWKKGFRPTPFRNMPRNQSCSCYNRNEQPL